jgi:hypothetical protein
MGRGEVNPPAVIECTSQRDDRRTECAIR